MEDLDLTKDIEITDIDELKSLLDRAYWIEGEFEQSFQWEAYSHIQEKHRDLIFKLSHDSQGHKSLLKKLINNIDGISIEDVENSKTGKEFQYRPRWEDSEVFGELLKYEFLAKDIYSRIKEHTSEKLIDDIWMGDNSEEFFKAMEYLIEEEQKHIDLVRPHAGSIQRIK